MNNRRTLKISPVIYNNLKKELLNLFRIQSLLIFFKYILDTYSKIFTFLKHANLMLNSEIHAYYSILSYIILIMFENF